MSTQAPIPTVGRVVLVPVEHKRHGETKIEILPALVTHVHSDQCISVVVFNAYGTAAAEQKTSLIYSQDDKRPGSWHWMPYQLAAPKA